MDPMVRSSTATRLFVLAALTLPAAACQQACDGEPLEHFACELERGVTTLIDAMDDASGLDEGSFTAVPSGNSIEFEYPRIQNLGHVAAEVGGRFNGLPMYLYLPWSHAGVSAEEERQFRELVETQRSRYLAALNALKDDIRAHPEDYKAPLRVRDPFSLYRAPSFRFAENGELHVPTGSMSSSRLVVMDRLFDYDADAVMALVREARSKLGDRPDEVGQVTD